MSAPATAVHATLDMSARLPSMRGVLLAELMALVGQTGRIAADAVADKNFSMGRSFLQSGADWADGLALVMRLESVRALCSQDGWCRHLAAFTIPGGAEVEKLRAGTFLRDFGDRLSIDYVPLLAAAAETTQEALPDASRAFYSLAASIYSNGKPPGMAERLASIANRLGI